LKVLQKDGEALVEIVPCSERLDELVQFVVRLNSDGAHHIGFFGEGEAEVRASLAECRIPPAEGFRLAYEENTLIGVFGVDADPEINRAWLFGPLADHEDWHTVADQLYAEVLPLIPVDIRDYDLFCDIQNTRIQAFAARHGFPLNSENAVLTLKRENYRPAAARKTNVTSFRGELFDQFEQLHRILFPNAYFTARQMVDKIDGNHQLFLAVEDNRLLGYNFCKLELDSDSGYVDFIGTDPDGRRHGIGADLLAAGVDWMLAAPSTMKVNLTVNADNRAARALYEKFGFVTDRIMRGYRKRIV
jgi:ribosomal protein S18 acetylase RimI-like enzyme